MDVSLEPGDVLQNGRYEIEVLIRRADTKTVYRAYDRKFDCQVALDVFSKNAPLPRGRTAAAWETRTLGRLGSHPNIGTVTDHWEEGERTFMASRYLPGGSVKALIDQVVEAGTPLAAEKILELAGGIASGLDHIHSCGLLYRDLQPRNVLLDEWGAPRLVDFDTATHVGDDDLGDLAQRPIEHMAPEAALGTRFDVRSDLYALGTTLYELCTGRPPYAGTREEILAGLQAESSPSIDRLDLPDGLHQLIASLLAINPEERPANAADVVDRIAELRAELADLPQLLTRAEILENFGEEVSAAIKDEELGKATPRFVHAVELRIRLERWEPDTLPPEWMPNRIVAKWATTPPAVAYWRQGLDRAPKLERARLVRYGVRRKGGVGPDSLTARGLADIVSSELPHWQSIASMATDYYDRSGDLQPDDIPDIAADPVAAYVEGIPAEVVLLVGVALDLDEASLREIADDFVADDSASGPSAAEARRFEAENRAAEAADLRDQLKKADKGIGKLTKERDALNENLERLRTLEREAGSAEKQLADEQRRVQDALLQIAELEAELDGAREEAGRVEELTSQVQALEQLRDQLLDESTNANAERALRIKAEEEVQHQIRKVGEFTRQLRDAAHAPSLPVSDGPSLIAALRGPLAQAAAEAAERMASGASAPGDAKLLAFAGNFASFADEMPPPAEPVETIVQPADEPHVPHDQGASAQPVATPGPNIPDESPIGVEPHADELEEPVEPRKSAISLRRRDRRLPEFTARPIGGAEEVGGSAVLVRSRSGGTVLLDAGQRVKGEYGPESTNQFHYGVPGVEQLHAILIGHAHIDHIGSLPLIHRLHSDMQNEAVPVMMTEPTRVLGEVMLNDSAKIQQAREQTLSSLAESDFGDGVMDAAYSFPDVAACLSEEHVVIAEQYKPVPVEGTGLIARFLPVSHVLGSCAIHLTDSQTGATLLYSGDLGPLSEPQITLPDFSGTSMLDKADVLIMESTYGQLRAEEREGRRRGGAGRERATAILADVATKTLEDGGHMLLPAFSLGRTQELAMIIQQERGRSMPEGKIYVAGMGEKITEIYDNFDRPRDPWRRPGEFPQTTSIRKWLSGGNTFQDVVAEVLESEPGYIIASPAMMSSGWSRAFLDAMVGDPRHAIVFTGYLPRHAGNIPNLRDLYQGAAMRLDGENRLIACRWEKVGLSAHAPSVDLERFARDLCQGRDTVHVGLVHGTVEAQRELADRLTDQLADATVRSLRNGEPWVPGRA
jgi:Cft2 family RNA processing exonuclease